MKKSAAAIGEYQESIRTFPARKEANQKAIESTQASVKALEETLIDLVNDEMNAQDLLKKMWILYNINC